MSGRTFGPERVVGFGSAFGAESSARSSSMAPWNLLLQRQTTRSERARRGSCPSSDPMHYQQQLQQQSSSSHVTIQIRASQSVSSSRLPPSPFFAVPCLLSLVSCLWPLCRLSDTSVVPIFYLLLFLSFLPSFFVPGRVSRWWRGGVKSTEGRSTSRSRYCRLACRTFPPGDGIGVSGG